MVFIVLVYNSGNQNVPINDWYACLQVLSINMLYVWNAYLSLLGYILVIAGLYLPYNPVFPLIRLCTGIELLYITIAIITL